MSKIAAHSSKTRSPQMQAQPNDSIFALPPELRNWVYREPLVGSTIRVHSDDENVPPEPALLQACRQIRHETLGIYYLENRFLFVIEYDRADNYIRWCNGVEHRQLSALSHSEVLRNLRIPTMGDHESRGEVYTGAVPLLRAVDKFCDAGMGRSETLAHLTAMMRADPLRRTDLLPALIYGVFEALELDGSGPGINDSSERSPRSSSSQVSVDNDQSDSIDSFGTDDEDEEGDAEDASGDESSEGSGESEDGSECSEDSKEGDDSSGDGIGY
ncbi:hypothetical protein LTR86_001155 [Recurvomyces mirabilis]|nr:hypothetical protein LTR86_001155 [Recurvomyces mirabilis]